MWAVLASKGMMYFEEAFEHLERMRDAAESLTHSTNAVLADRGREKLRWARWLAADTLEQMGRTEEALTNYHLPLLSEMKALANDAPDERARFSRTWDLRDSFNSVGRCLLKLGRPQEAVDYLRQAVPYAEKLTARQPVNSAAASMLVESKARLAEALLSIDQPDEALPILESALGRSQYLQECDP